MIRRVKHGMTIGGKHTYADYRLVPTSRPVFQPPEPDRISLSVPGMDGILDMSTALTGRVNFKERIGEFEFYVEKPKNWATTYSTIQNELHGTYQRVVFDDDPDFYYDAFIQIDEWKSNPTFSSIVMTMSAKPYKLKLTDTVISHVLTSTPIELHCKNLRKPVVPTIKTTGATKVEFNGKTISIGAGTHTLDILFLAGDNIIKASGTGTITVTYREGGL